MNDLRVIPMQTEHIEFIVDILTSDKNKAALYLGDRSLSERRDIFVKNLVDSGEANFAICKDAVTVAWLRINGLQSAENIAWLSMLVVHESYQRQGIGSFAISFAEDFVRLKGFSMLGIHINADNIAAQNCYKKLGYHIHKDGECTNDDGVIRRSLSLHRDNLDAVRMSIDGVPFHIGEQHDFSFISKIGRVFRIFDAMDSGNICFGVERDGKRFFVKYAGAKTQNYDGEIADAIARLKYGAKLYEILQHPNLIRLIDHYPVGDGYAAIFDWVNGEGLRSYWDFVGKSMWSYPASPNYRFRHLPIHKRIAVVDKIMAFHQHVIECGYIPVDFYDGSMIYDFDTDDFHICDIDFYRKAPAKNDMGRMWGTSRFMSPEEYELGADLDEKTVVYLMGTTAFELLSNSTDEAYQAWNDSRLSRTINAWSATKALFDVAMKATSAERDERYQTLAELIEAWNAAKDLTNIQYRQLLIDDLAPDMLMYLNRYQFVQNDWYPDENGGYYLVYQPHIEDWSYERKKEIVSILRSTLNNGGKVFGAYDEEKLIGFSSIDGIILGRESQYIELTWLHVSYEYRGQHIGKKLFHLCVEAAAQYECRKLYIVASSSEESQKAYHKLGCVYAKVHIPHLYAQRPDSVHMEYLL